MIPAMKRFGPILAWAFIYCIPVSVAFGGVIDLTLRSRGGESNEVRFSEVKWDPKKTVIIVCDMWDEHWCESATRRVAEMAGPLNVTLEAARAQGELIVHAPSSVTSFYENTLPRKLALNTSRVSLPDSAKAQEGWETGWCLWDDSVEAPLPIDDSDGGCSCEDPECVAEMPWPWTRQIDTIENYLEDAISDDGKEIFFRWKNEESKM